MAEGFCQPFFLQPCYLIGRFSSGACTYYSQQLAQVRIWAQAGLWSLWQAWKYLLEGAPVPSVRSETSWEPSYSAKKIKNKCQQHVALNVVILSAEWYDYLIIRRFKTADRNSSFSEPDCLTCSVKVFRSEVLTAEHGWRIGRKSSSSDSFFPFSSQDSVFGKPTQ